MSLYVDIEKDLGSFKLKVKLEAGDETLALLGASGCGESLTLKCIAGIERPDRGRIVVDDTVLFDSEQKINLTPQQRRTGLMFQSYALFPNMTVMQNINTGAVREADKQKRKAAVAAVMDGGLIQRHGKKDEVFSDPRTVKAAILTGCKNISAIERMDAGQVWATDWDIPLKLGPIPEDAAAIGIRMHDIRPGPGENAFRCKVAEEIENPFSYTLMLRPLGTSGASPLGWEIDKDTWKRIRAEEIAIGLPPEALLVLKT